MARTWALGGSQQAETIEVVRYTFNPRWEPTKGRWEAYNWRVVGVERQEVSPTLL